MLNEQQLKTMFPHPDSFEESHWVNCTREELRDLIMAFSTLEAKEEESANAPLWRKRRKESISVFERRFGAVPDVFQSDQLPKPFGSVLYDKEVKAWW